MPRRYPRPSRINSPDHPLQGASDEPRRDGVPCALVQRGRTNRGRCRPTGATNALQLAKADAIVFLVERQQARSSRAPYPFGDVKACLDHHQATRSPSISVAASRIGPESSAHESSTRSATARRTVRSTIGLPLLQRHELILRKRARHGVSRAGNVDLLFGILGP